MDELNSSIGGIDDDYLNRAMKEDDTEHKPKKSYFLTFVLILSGVILIIVGLLVKQSKTWEYVEIGIGSVLIVAGIVVAVVK